MTALKVGDICVGQNFIFYLDRNGMECTIIGGLMAREAIDLVTNQTVNDIGFLVEWEDGEVGPVRPYLLRKKYPPDDEASEIRQATLDVIERARRGAEVPA